MKVKEIIKMMEKDAWFQIRQKGSTGNFIIHKKKVQLRWLKSQVMT